MEYSAVPKAPSWEEQWNESPAEVQVGIQEKVEEREMLCPEGIQNELKRVRFRFGRRRSFEQGTEVHIGPKYLPRCLSMACSQPSGLGT